MNAKYQPKNFTHLLGTPGFSDRLLKDHFSLYEGYVKNTNTLYEDINELFRQKKFDSPEAAEIRRRFGWEFNGMKLHEYYFGNLKREGTPLPRHSDLAKKIAEQFHSLQNWERDFKWVAATRGIGWAILSYDSHAHRLFNIWVNEHDQGFLADSRPLLVLDAFEHAHITDYGIKRDAYIGAFFKALHWEAVLERFEEMAIKKYELSET